MTIRTNSIDGSSIALNGSTFEVSFGSDTIALKLSATRFWAPPSRYEVTGVRVDEDAGTITVMFARNLVPPRVREATFNLDTGVRISQSSEDMTASQVLFREMWGIYGTTAGLGSNGDLTGDGLVTAAPTVAVDSTVATNGLAGDASALFTLTGGGLGIADENDGVARKIAGSRGDYVLPRGYEAVGVREDKGGYQLLLRKTELDGSSTFVEQFVRDDGVYLRVVDAWVTITGRALVDAENNYGLDLNGDMVIGDAETIVARLDAAVNAAPLGANGSVNPSDAQDGIGVYRTMAGRLVIADDEVDVGDLAGSGAVFLKTGSGANWSAPTGHTVFAVREIGSTDTYQVVTRSGNLGAATTTYSVYNVAATGLVGSSVTVAFPQLIQLERSFRQDFDGNGVIGDIVDKRADASVRIGAGERALYFSEGKALFISHALDKANDEPLWNGDADSTRLLRDTNGITSEDGPVWSPALNATGAEGIGVRETANSYIVLSRIPKVQNPLTPQDYDYIEQSFSKDGLQIRGRFFVEITPRVEALYFQDFNDDGVIDARTVSFDDPAQFFITPNGARLDGERLIVTAAQAAAMSQADRSEAGVLAVEGNGAFDTAALGSTRFFSAGAFNIDRKFLLVKPEDSESDPAYDNDVLSLEVSGTGAVTDFRFTVPGHALDATSTVLLSGLPEGVTATLLDAEGNPVGSCGGGGEFQLQAEIDGDCDLSEGAELAGGTYVLRIDTTGAESSGFSFTLTQTVPYGWERSAIARENVLQIVETMLTADLDLRQVDPDHVVIRFGAPDGTSLEVPAGRTLTLHAEHAAALTLTGAGTVVLLGDLRGHDFSGVQVATIDFSQADEIAGGEDAFELNFATDADLWPAFEEGNLWIIRGGQADIVSNTEGLKIDGALAVPNEFGRTSVGNIRIVDTVEGLDLSGVDVAYIDMAGAIGTPSELPAIGEGRFVVLRGDQATGLVGEFSGARLHLISDLSGYGEIDEALEDYSLEAYLADNGVDFGAINLGGGMFTAVVDSSLTVNAESDLGALQITVLGADTTLTLTGAQADGRIINDSVSIWTRDTERNVPQEGVAGSVVITDADAEIDLSNIGLIVGINGDSGVPDEAATQNENLHVTLSFSTGEGETTIDFTSNDSFGDVPTAPVRATDGLPPPALRIDAYVVAADVTVTLRANQASFREASGNGTIEMIGLDAGTDLWGFQRGTSPRVEVVVAQEALTLASFLEAGLDKANLWIGDNSVEPVSLAQLESGANLAWSNSGSSYFDPATAGDKLVVLVDGRYYLIGADGSTNFDGIAANIYANFFDVDAATLQNAVNEVGDALDLRANRSLDDAVDEYDLGSRDTLMLEVQATGRIIIGEEDTALKVYGLQDNTDLSAVSHDLDVTTFQTGTVDIRGNLNLATVDTFNIGADNVLRADSALLGDSVAFIDGTAEIYVAASEVLTKTFTLTLATNATLHLATGADIKGATLTGVDTYALANDASVTMTIAQHNAVTSITGGGTETITFSDAGTATGFAQVETYVLAAGANTFTLGALAQNVTGGTGENTLVFGAGAYTGTFTGFGADDTYRVVDGTNLSATAGLTAGILDFQNQAATVTLNAAQNGSLTILNASNAQTIVVTQADTFTADAAIETYRLTGASTITVVAGTNVEVADGDTAIQTVIVNGLTTTGAYNLGGGATDRVAINATSDISGSAFTGVDRVTLGNNVNATMTIAQNALIDVATGTNSVTLSDAGTATGFAQVETYVLAAGANTFTLGALAQNVTGGTGENTLVFGAGAYTGTFTGFGADDTYRVVDGTNLSATAGLTAGILDFQNQAATVTLNAAQNGSLTILNASNAQTIVVTQADTFTADAAIETYVLSDAGNDLTVNAEKLNVNVTGGSGDDKIEVGGLVLTGGNFQLNAGSNVLRLDDGADISAVTLGATGGTFTFSISPESSVTMSVAQHEGAEEIGVFGDGNIAQITLSDAGNATGGADVLTYVLADGDQTFTVGAAGQAVTTGSGSVTISTSVVTGTLDGSAGNVTLDVSAGELDFSGVTLTSIETLAVANGATVTLTAAQASGMTGSGSGTVIVTGLGDTTDLSAFSADLTLEVTVTNNIDVTANTNLGPIDEITVAAGSELTISVAQLTTLALGAGKINGAGNVVVTGVTEDTPDFSSVFDVEGRVTAVLDGDVAAGQLPAWATDLRLDGQTITVDYSALQDLVSDFDLAAGPGRIALVGTLPDPLELDLSGIPVGTNVLLTGLSSASVVTITGRADGVFVTPGQNLVGLLDITEGTGAETLTFKSGIQAAINDAQAGDAVVVGAGEFLAPRLGYIDVNKSISLWGNQAGLKAEGTEARDALGESIIRVSQEVNSGAEFVAAGAPLASTSPSSTMIRVVADNVTIDGFTLTGFHRDAINVRIIDTVGETVARENVTITNNIITMSGRNGGSFTDPALSRLNQYNGIVFGEFTGDPARSAQTAVFEDITISGNFIDVADTAVSGNGRGVVLTNHFTNGPGLTYTDLVIEGNTIKASGTGLFVPGVVAKTFIEGGSVVDNAFIATTGFNAPNVDGMEISGNTFNTTSSGLSLSAINSTITDNEFSLVNFFGINLRNDVASGGLASSGNTVDGNTFSYNGNGVAGATVVAGIAVHSTDAATIGTGNVFNDGAASDAVVSYETVIYVPGTAAAETLAGTAADEVFFSFALDDTFVFSGSDIGRDTIGDFTGAGVVGGDLLDFRAMNGVNGINELEIVVANGNTVITSSAFEGSITLIGVTTALTSDDFLF